MKILQVSILLASFAFTSITSPTVAIAAAFQNGSFENGLTGWTIVTNSGGERVSSIEGATQDQSAFNFNAFQAVGNGVLAQSFNTAIGQTYLLNFDFGNFGLTSGYKSMVQAEVRDGASATGGTELIGFNTAFAIVGNNTGFSEAQNGAVVTATDLNAPANNSAFFTAVPASPEFSTVSFMFTALSTTSTLVFSDLTGTTGQFSDGVLDNVRLTTVVPEPSTLALGAVGLVGLIYRRARFTKNS